MRALIPLSPFSRTQEKEDKPAACPHPRASEEPARGAIR